MEKLSLDNLENVAGGQYDHDGPTVKATVITATKIYSTNNVNSPVIRSVGKGDTVTIYRDPEMKMDGHKWKIVKRDSKDAYIDGYCLSY